MLTREAALQFVRSQLAIHDVETKLKSDRVDLLNELTHAFLQLIPYQNITLLAEDPSKRGPPSEETIISDVTSGRGGLCMTVNGFFQRLLSALGYNAYFVVCDVLVADLRDAHIIVIVKGVENDDDLFMTDFAFDVITFDPVPLHDLPKTYEDKFYTYRVEKEGDTYVRYNYRRTAGVWKKICTFKVDEPKTLVYFQTHENMIRSYNDPSISIFLKYPVALVYPQGRAFGLVKHELRTWNEESKTVVKQNLESVDETESSLLKYFPTIPKEHVHEAMRIWRKIVEDEKNCSNNEGKH